MSARSTEISSLTTGAVGAVAMGALFIILVEVSVAGSPIFPERSVNVTDRVAVPTSKLLKSIPVIWSVAVAIVPLPVTVVAPPEVENV